MPPFMNVKSLHSQAENKLAKLLHNIFSECESHKQVVRQNSLQTLCGRLPGTVLDGLIVSCCTQLISAYKLDRSHPGLAAMLSCLLHSQVTKIDLGDLFLRIRLPSKITGGCLSVLTTSLPNLSLLTSLILISKCSDEMIVLVAKHCLSLRELNISFSNISDSGLIALASSDLMNTLEILGINKCWSTTVSGVAHLFMKVNHIYNLQYDQMGDLFALLFTKQLDRDIFYPLENFEQTINPFNPIDGLMGFIVQKCPQVTTLKIISEDTFVPRFGEFISLNSVCFELSTPPSIGFKRFIQERGRNLHSLFINCNVFHCHILAAIFQHCTQLRCFKLICKSFEGSKFLEGVKVDFNHLEVLELSWWGDPPVPQFILDIFFHGSRNYQQLLLSGDMPFFTDSYFKSVFVKDHFEKLEVLMIQSAPDIPLSIKSVKHICEVCPSLKQLGIKWWNVSSQEIYKFTRQIRENNWDLVVD